MRFSPRILRALGTMGVGLFLAVNLLNTSRKGGDFDDYIEAGRRLLDGAPLYAGSTTAFGFVGPPAQVLLFAPFALLDPQVAKVLWFVLNIVLLWWALATWLGLLSPTTTPVPAALARAVPPGAVVVDGLAWRRGVGRFTSLWGVLPILAVAAPLQSQFEHQNLNVVLLALAAWAAEALMRGRASVAGVALGIAAAIKVYPVLAVVWLALRRQWRAFGAAVAATILIGVAPALFRGVDRFLVDLHDWRAIVAAGWPTRRANQSMAAMWGRYLLGEGPEGYPTLTFDHTWVLWLTVAAALVLIAPLVIAWWRVPAYSVGIVEEIVCVNGIAILISPIAWEHYWVGFFPLFLLLGLYARRARDAQAAWPHRWAAVAFWAGIVCVTLLSRPLIGAAGAHVVRAWSLMTWAGVLMCVTFGAIVANRRVTARVSLSMRRVPEVAQADDGDGRRAGG